MFRPSPSRRGAMRMLVLAVVAGLLATANSGEDDLQKEWARLQGTWQLVAAETDGQPAPAERPAQTRVVIQRNRHTVYFGEKAIAKDVRVQIDPGQRPKT